MRYTSTLGRLISLLTVAISAAVLLGFIFRIESLQAGLPGYNTMKFNAALCLLACGLLLWLGHLPPGRIVTAAYYFLTFFITTVGLLTLAEHTFDADLYIDNLFFKAEETAGNFYPGRMSASSAVNFVLLAVVFFSLPRPRMHRYIFPVLVFITLSAVIVIFNHLSGLEFFKTVTFFSATAFHTALVFLCVGIGILFSPHLQYIRVPFQQKIFISFLAVCIILAVTFSAFNKGNKQFINTALMVRQSTEILLLNQRLLKESVDIESGARGFVITGNPAFLNNYNRAVTNIPTLINELRKQTKDNATQQLRIDRLEKLIEQSKKLRQHFIDVRRQQGREAALAEVARGGGLAVSNEIQKISDEIEAAETHLLSVKKAANEKTFENPSRFSTLFLAATFLLLTATFLAILRNKKSRDKAETELIKSRRLLKAIIDNTGNPICVRDPKGKFLIANKAFHQLVQQDESIVGKNLVEVLPEKLSGATQKSDKEVLETKETRVTEQKLVVNNITRYLNGCVFPVVNENNEVYAIGSVATDITERKLAEKAILDLNRDLAKQVEQKTKQVIEKEKQYRFLLQNMREGIQIIGFDWKYLFVNESVARQGQYRSEELVGKTMMEKYPGIEKTALFQVLQQCMEERREATYENQFAFPDGTKRWFELSIQPVPEGLFILSMDITERKEAEERLQLALDAGEIGWWELDLVKNEAVRNYLHDKIFGYEYPLAHWDRDIFMEHVLEEDREIATQAFDRAGQTGRLELTLRIKTADGAVRWISAQGKVKEQDTPQPRMLGTVIDITELKLAEEKISRHAEELKKSNTELERFAYVASHDLQEPIRMVSSFLNLLVKRLNGQLDATNRQYIDFALDGAERMKVLINDLLDYSRISNASEKMSRVDLNQVIDYVKRLLADSIASKNATIIVEPLPVITASETLMNQLFVNLVSNALKFHGEKPPVIEIGAEESEPQWTFFVRDHGIGIDPKFFDKIFIIFQRLHNKSEYAGTGIGLSICKKIVEVHNGKIWIESKPGDGTTFFFSLPKKPVPV